ncbi:MAG: hypothetical protein QXJ75_00875 [Candidatus Bathyarchaeia archaeon]
MKGRKIGWLIWFTFFVVIDFAVPYLLLKDVQSFYGAYLFWVLITIIVLVSAIVYMRPWKDVKSL